MKHEILEKNVGLLALCMAVAVSIGGLTQIVPLFFQDVTNTPVEGMKPYTALQLEGRDIYIREGCVGCHSQMIPRYGSMPPGCTPRMSSTCIWWPRQTNSISAG